MEEAKAVRGLVVIVTTNWGCCFIEQPSGERVLRNQVLCRWFTIFKTVKDGIYCFLAVD